jgi:hypothetical protein
MFTRADDTAEATVPARPPRPGPRGLAGAALAAGLAAVLMPGPASAQPDDTSSGTTEATIEVQTAIALTGLTSGFTLTGVPGATVTGLSVVTFTVETNNFAGYAITVQSRTAALEPGTVANPDSIPIGALSVRETGATTFTPLSSTTTVTVHTQAVRSDEGGDDLSNDYQVVIPFVNEDTYATTLDYVAATL